jgi:hypothetical protein
MKKNKTLPFSVQMDAGFKEFNNIILNQFRMFMSDIIIGVKNSIYIIG